MRLPCTGSWACLLENTKAHILVHDLPSFSFTVHQMLSVDLHCNDYVLQCDNRRVTLDQVASQIKMRPS